MRINMGYKTISLSEDAYNRLFKRKIGSESFSDVIIRLTNDTTLRNFVGLLRDETCDEIEKNIIKFRRQSLDQFTKSLVKDWGSEVN